MIGPTTDHRQSSIIDHETRGFVWKFEDRISQVPHPIQCYHHFAYLWSKTASVIFQTQLFQNSRCVSKPDDKNQGPSWFCDIKFRWSMQASSGCLDICFPSLIRCCGSLSVLVRPHKVPDLLKVTEGDLGHGAWFERWGKCLETWSGYIWLMVFQAERTQKVGMNHDLGPVLLEIPRPFVILTGL